MEVGKRKRFDEFAGPFEFLLGLSRKSYDYIGPDGKPWNGLKEFLNEIKEKRSTIISVHLS
jgi:hypothetical protein